MKTMNKQWKEMSEEKWKDMKTKNKKWKEMTTLKSKNKCMFVLFSMFVFTFNSWVLRQWDNLCLNFVLHDFTWENISWDQSCFFCVFLFFFDKKMQKIYKKTCPSAPKKKS